jgi:SET domain-containing protein 6
MAYSFTEPPPESNENDSDSDDSDSESDATVTNLPPMMVPMADVLNHIAKNNARLDFGVGSLKMVATKSITAVSFAVLQE